MLGQLGYFHRMKAGEDGACGVDETLDFRLNSRLLPGETFRNPFIAFKLREVEDEASVAQSLQLTGAGARVDGTVVAAELQRTDTLPVQVRYMPNVGKIFVVDSASQGLRTFSLSNFAIDETSDNTSFR